MNSPVKHLMMFDIDDTLVSSGKVDTECFVAAVQDVLQITVNTDWSSYEHVTDAGILFKTMQRAGISPKDNSLVEAVKEQFVLHLTRELAQSDFAAIAGATQFLRYLCQRSDFKVSLATGAWSESAGLKLRLAGFDTDGVSMASSSDHFARVEIMKISERRACADDTCQKIYFGDGPWDLKAAEALGYHFVLVGDRIDWSPSIANYTDIESVLSAIDLNR